MGKVAVVGAGPAGCYAAYQLQARGHEVILFDADEAVGGRTKSYRHEGYTLDTGAAFITNFYPLTHRLIKQLGLTEAVVSVTRSTALSHAGEIAQLTLGSAKSFVKYPFLTPTDKAKMAFHVSKLMARRFQYHLTDLKKLAKYDDLSIADYTRRALSENIYQNVVRPGVEPFWYFSCETVSRALYLALTAHAPDAKFFIFKEGIDRLCAALASAVSHRLGQPVLAIQAHEGAFRVSTQASSRQGEEAVHTDGFEGVVIATTASVAQAITAPLSATWVTEQQRDFLRTQQYVPNTHCVYKTAQFARHFDALSVFPCGPGVHPVAAISFNAQKCAQLRAQGMELISVYLGADCSAQMQSSGQLRARMNTPENDTEMTAAYERALDLCPALPALAEVSPFYRVHRQEAIPVHAVGRYRLALTFQQWQQQQVQRGRTLGQGVHFVGDYLSTATVEGALASVAALC